MKVTFIFAGYSRLPVGGYRVVYEYANRLARRGYEVQIVYCRGVKGFARPATVFRRLQSEAMYLYRSLIKPNPAWQFVDPAVRALFVPEPLERYIPDGDVVFATAWPLADYVLNYSKRKGKKCYLYQHYETWSGPREQVDASWKAPFYKVVISKWLYEVGQSLGATRMTYIPNGLDHDLFRIQTPIRGRSPIVSMMFSRQAWKGTADGLQALYQVKKKFSRLRVLGFGVYKPENPLPEWIEYVDNPKQDDLVAKIYNASSCFLWSSHTEGFSLPPAEAMACGCAVVTTDCGGINDFAENGVSALISEPRNSGKLAENLLKFLEDDNLRVRIAEEGSRSIRKLTWQNSFDLMEKFLADCVGEG